MHDDIYGIFNWWKYEYDELITLIRTRETAIEVAKFIRRRGTICVAFEEGKTGILVRHFKIGQFYNLDSLEKDQPRIIFEC